MHQSQIYIGPAGWSYDDWKGIVYPGKQPRGWHALRYLSQFFNSVEINSSFYRPPAATTTSRWVTLVQDHPDFLFTYKLWQEFTHSADAGIEPAKIKPVREGLIPLHEAGRLGAVLIQFPWSFKYSPSSLDRIKRLVDTFAEFPLALEIRHNSWNRPDVMDYLREYNVAFVNIDQPVISNSIPWTQHLTASFSYFRFHGRNDENWFNEKASGAQRYDYMYQEDELADLISSIESLITRSPKAFMIFNNHYKGQAIANALQTMFLLDHQQRDIPPQLLTHYPSLQSIARPSPHGDQLSIF